MANTDEPPGNSDEQRDFNPSSNSLDRVREARFFLEQLMAVGLSSAKGRWFYHAFLNAAHSVTDIVEFEYGRHGAAFYEWWADWNDRLTRTQGAKLVRNARNTYAHRSYTLRHRLRIRAAGGWRFDSVLDHEGQWTLECIGPFSEMQLPNDVTPEQREEALDKHFGVMIRELLPKLRDAWETKDDGERHFGFPDDSPFVEPDNLVAILNEYCETLESAVEDVIARLDLHPANGRIARPPKR